MIKNTVLYIIFSFFGFLSNAQQLELGFGASVNSYQGDLREPLGGLGELSGYLNNHLKTLHAGANFFVRYNFSPKISLRGGILYTNLSGSDAISNIPGRRVRNLSFKSHLLEFSAVGEYNLFPMGLDIHSRTWTPYFYTGIALFNFNPKTLYQGEWVDLQPLGTEGQDLYQYPERKMYALTQFALPVGFGVKFLLSKSFVLGVDVGYRFAFTDYLDDVSSTYVDPELLRATRGPRSADLSNRQAEINPRFPGVEVGRARGNADNNDGYYSLSLSITYRLHKYDCPTFRR